MSSTDTEHIQEQSSKDLKYKWSDDLEDGSSSKDLSEVLHEINGVGHYINSIVDEWFVEKGRSKEHDAQMYFNVRVLTEEQFNSEFGNLDYTTDMQEIIVVIIDSETGRPLCTRYLEEI